MSKRLQRIDFFAKTNHWQQCFKKFGYNEYPLKISNLLCITGVQCITTNDPAWNLYHNFTVFTCSFVILAHWKGTLVSRPFLERATPTEESCSILIKVTKLSMVLGKIILTPTRFCPNTRSSAMSSLESSVGKDRHTHCPSLIFLTTHHQKQKKEKQEIKSIPASPHH